jgi:hypothetical protein
VTGRQPSAAFWEIAGLTIPDNNQDRAGGLDINPGSDHNWENASENSFDLSLLQESRPCATRRTSYNSRPSPLCAPQEAAALSHLADDLSRVSLFVPEQGVDEDCDSRMRVIIATQTGIQPSWMSLGPSYSRMLILVHLPTGADPYDCNMVLEPCRKKVTVTVKFKVEFYRAERIFSHCIGLDTALQGVLQTALDLDYEDSRGEIVKTVDLPHKAQNFFRCLSSHNAVDQPFLFEQSEYKAPGASESSQSQVVQYFVGSLLAESNEVINRVPLNGFRTFMVGRNGGPGDRAYSDGGEDFGGDDDDPMDQGRRERRRCRRERSQHQPPPQVRPHEQQVRFDMLPSSNGYSPGGDSFRSASSNVSL